jgi:hypothetical protein
MAAMEGVDRKAVILKGKVVFVLKSKVLEAMVETEGVRETVALVGMVAMEGN